MMPVRKYSCSVVVASSQAVQAISGGSMLPVRVQLFSGGSMLPAARHYRC
jgi:hypothetical protein